MCCDACEKVIVTFPDVTDASVGLTDVRTTFLGLEHFSSLAVFRGSDSALISSKYFTFTLMHLADAFIQRDLHCIQVIHFIVSMCVPWESNPQPFALLTQYSTTEPQEQF